jgi:hypothetical protein
MSEPAIANYVAAWWRVNAKCGELLRHMAGLYHPRYRSAKGCMIFRVMAGENEKEGGLSEMPS